MNCPRCGFSNSATHAECARCGVVFAKVQWAPFDAAAAHGAGVEHPSDDRAHDPESAEWPRERWVRLCAVPCALLFAWAAVRGVPGPVRLLTMWVHETGHAVAAWFCGYAAFPGPWFTPVGSERSFFVTVLLLALIGGVAARAWREGRVAAAAAGAVALVAALVGTFGLHPGQAEQVIVFSGDAGSFVLGAALMLTVYASADSPLRADGLRWGLLPLGALALMDVLLVWTGPFDALPFGATDHGLSDPSVLAEMFGWSALTLTRRYRMLAGTCLACLGGAYLLGLGGGSSARSTRPSQARISLSWTAAPIPTASGASASSVPAPDASRALMASNSSRAARSGSCLEP